MPFSTSSLGGEEGETLSRSPFVREEAISVVDRMFVGKTDLRLPRRRGSRLAA
jgi:hypothetical protein